MSMYPEIIDYPTGYHSNYKDSYFLEYGLVIDIQYQYNDFLFNVLDKFSQYDTSEFGDLAKYQSKYDNERELYSMWQMEAFNMNGIPALWHVITFDTNYDSLFGEDNNKRVERSFPVMMYIPETPDNIRLWTVFGTEGVNDLIFYVNKEHFKHASMSDVSTADWYNSKPSIYPSEWSNNHTPSMEQSGTSYSTGGLDNNRFSEEFQIGYPLKSYIPKVGDVFVLQYDNFSVYEVKRVKEEEEMFLQKKHCWVIESTKLYVNEHINKNKTGANPTNFIDSEFERIIDSEEIFNDGNYVETMKSSTETVSDTFPAYTGKGKVNPFYNPMPNESAPKDLFGGF